MYVFGMHSICLTDLHLKRTFVWIDMAKLCIARLGNNEPNKYMTIMIIIISNSFAGMCQFHCKTPICMKVKTFFFLSFQTDWKTLGRIFFPLCEYYEFFLERKWGLDHMWYFLTFQEFYDTNLTGINKVENQVGSVFFNRF